MLSAGEDGLNHARRESFNQALTRKSVLSFIEKQSKISVKVKFFCSKNFIQWVGESGKRNSVTLSE